jgi:predicted O-linked N-acetylglucosamine transferase (SPINDLY family)
MSSIDADRAEADRLLQQDQYFEALGAYNKVVSTNPSDARAWLGIGMALMRTLQWEQSAETFKFVLQLDPNNARARYGLSAVLFQWGEQQAARDMVDQACALVPDDWQFHQWRAYVHATMPGATPADTLALYREWGRKFADPLTDRATPLPALTREQKNPGRRLKVGYVSGDMRQHSVAFFMEPVFAHHHAEAVEVFVYANNPRDDYTERLAAPVPNWFDVAGLSDDELLKLIRSHQIDVLVDLSGHTVGHRLFVFARRAAPVQVTWLGFLHTTGMKAMDYRLTDASFSPPGAEQHNSERLFRLERMISYTPPPDSPEVAALPMLAQGHPMLISLNNLKKITDEVLLMWRDILARRSDARLVLMTQDSFQDKAEAHALPRLERLGLPLERIFISRRLPLEDFMALGGLADVALDTFPISGGTTTLHSLWMGLPVVALAGDDETSGSTASMLHGFGYDDWVTADKEAYIGKVLELLDNPQRLQEHRRTVRQRMRASPVMNYAERTAELEQAYRLLWINHLLGEPRYLDTRQDMDGAMRQVEARQQQAVGAVGAKVGRP